MFATFRLECFGAGGDPPKLCEEAKKKKRKRKKTKINRKLDFSLQSNNKNIHHQ